MAAGTEPAGEVRMVHRSRWEESSMTNIEEEEEVGAGLTSTASRDIPLIASPYLTAEEAAGYLRTTIQGIYSLVKRGRLQPMPGRPGRLLFTPPSPR
jgi:hypothetical protein